MRTVIACLLVATVGIPLAAGAAPSKNAPGPGSDEKNVWYVSTAAEAPCTSADPVVGLDLIVKRYASKGHPKFDKATSFACTSAAQRHGLTAEVLVLPSPTAAPRAEREANSVKKAGNHLKGPIGLPPETGTPSPSPSPAPRP